MAPLLVGLLAARALPARAADCPTRLERLDAVEAAEQALIEADLAATDLKLRELEASLACGGLAETELLGRLWLVEAAWLTMQGDTDAAGDSWRAAAAVAPGRWLDDYGVNLRRAYEQATARPSDDVATLTLDPPLFRWIGAIDGQIVDFPVTVPAGLHLVQVGPDQDHVAFARMLVAFSSAPSVVVTGLVEPTDEPGPVVAAPVPEPVLEDRFPVGVVSLYTAVGADLAFGRSVSRGEADEPAVKVLLPFQTGVVLRPSGPDRIQTWFRLTADAGLLVGGDFLHTDAYGDATTPAALGTQVAAGAASGRTDMGLLVGYQWPDRVPIRGVIAARLRQAPVQIEGRLGLNAAFGRNPEPAFDIAIAAIPTLFR